MSAVNKRSFEDSALANLSNAFEATWEILQAEESSDLEVLEELRHAVSGKLLKLAADGVTDPKELRNRVLESLDRSVPAEPKRTLIDRLGLRSRQSSRTKLESQLRR